MTPTVCDKAGRVRTLPELAKDEAAAAFAACRDCLPRGCDRQEAWNPTCAALNEVGPEFMVLAVAICQGTGVAADAVDRTALLAGSTFMQRFLDLAEAWRVGGRA